eukprot:gene22642-biopygen13294
MVLGTLESVRREPASFPGGIGEKNIGGEQLWLWKTLANGTTAADESHTTEPKETDVSGRVLHHSFNQEEWLGTRPGRDHFFTFYREGCVRDVSGTRLLQLLPASSSITLITCGSWRPPRRGRFSPGAWPCISCGSVPAQSIILHNRHTGRSPVLAGSRHALPCPLPRQAHTAGSRTGQRVNVPFTTFVPARPGGTGRWRGHGAGVARAIGYDLAWVARAWRGHGAGISCSPWCE